MDSQLLLRRGDEIDTYSVHFYRSDSFPPFSVEEKPLLFHVYRTVDGRRREAWFSVSVGEVDAQVEELFRDAPTIRSGGICFEDSSCAVIGKNLFVFGGRNSERRDSERCQRWVRRLDTESPSDGWISCTDLTVRRLKNMLGYAGNLVFLLPAKYNILHSDSLMVYETGLNLEECLLIPPPPPCLDCNPSPDKSFNSVFCANFGENVGLLVCDSREHLYRFDPPESWVKICHTTIPTKLLSYKHMEEYKLREYASLNGLLYVSYFCGCNLKTRIRVYDVRPIQFGNESALLQDILLPNFFKFGKSNSDNVRVSKAYLVISSDYRLCYVWRDCNTFSYNVAKVDLSPTAAYPTVDVMNVDLDDDIHIINCIRFDSYTAMEGETAELEDPEVASVIGSPQTTKGMKADNGVAEEIKLDSNLSISEKKLESSNLLTEEKVEPNNSRTGEKFSE